MTASRAPLRANVAEIAPEQAENDGWPQVAMPAMLDALGLTEAPEVRWFVAATSPLYDDAEPAAWRYCHTDGKPDLGGICYGGPPARIFLRADMSLSRTIHTLGHELWHAREFVRGEPIDEEAADAFGATALARFLASQYR